MPTARTFPGRRARAATAPRRPLTTEEFLGYLAGHPATAVLGRDLADVLVTSGLR